MSPLTILAAITGYVGVIAGLLFIWARFISIGQGPDNPPHQDTDSQSAISAGVRFDRHVAPRNTTDPE